MLMTCLQLIVKKPRIVQSHQLVKVHIAASCIIMALDGVTLTQLDMTI